MPDEFFIRKTTDACVVLPGELVPIAYFVPDDFDGCRFESGSGFVIQLEDEESEQPEQPDAAPPRKKTPMSSYQAPPVEVIDTAIPAASPDLLSSIPFPGDAGVPLGLQAALAAPADLKNAIPAAADTSPLTVIMAVVAVGGGAAAWKFYNNFSKQKHEQAMARIENEGRKQDDQHQKCATERQALSLRVDEIHAKVAGLDIRLNEIRRAIDDLRSRAPELPDFDPSDLEERLAKLEKLTKRGKK